MPTCVPRSCGVVQFPSSTPGSENDPLGAACSSDRQYRNVQEYVGDCSGQSPSVTASDGGSQHGKADGALCNTNEECLSSNCVSSDGVTFVCADACASGACASHETCVGGYCLPACSPSGSGACMKNADCPSDEVCGAFGQCEDTQSDAGIASVDATAEGTTGGTCSGLGQCGYPPHCALGCYLKVGYNATDPTEDTCAGAPEPCAQLYDESLCAAQGCTWSARAN
jgi:hypothetical protein